MSNTDHLIRRKDYKTPPFLIDDIELQFELTKQATVVTSEMTFRRNSESNDKGSALELYGDGPELLEVCLNEKALNQEDYQVSEKRLTLHRVPEEFKLKIKTKIFPQENTKLSGLYQSNHMYCTQCEAEGFRRITYFLDRPDIMSVYKTTIIADKKEYPVLLSNGNLIDSGNKENNTHFATWHDPFKKPSYLFALVAGDLGYTEDTFTTQSGRKVIIRIYVEKGNESKTKHAMTCVKQAMKWDEEKYGLEYDLDIFMIVAVSNFNMGAMENKGLNVFNDKYILVDEKTATDQDYENVIAVVGHEYFHNWTGNRVTLRDWFQLSLKEGLTMFREQQFTSDMTSEAVCRINEVNVIRTSQFREDAGSMAHPVRPDSYIEIDNFYTATVYHKGAELIRMLNTLLGTDGFRKGMDLYIKRHDGHAVTCDDFIQAMADANDAVLEQFVLWYSQAGTPKLKVSSEYDSIKKSYYLCFQQSCKPTPDQPIKKAFQIPVKIILYDQKGNVFDLHRGNGNKDDVILNVTKQEQRFKFSNINEKPVPSILCGFSAPVKLEYDYTDEELIFLIHHDHDDFNRWDAWQQYSTKVIFEKLADYQEGHEMAVDNQFIKTFKNILNTPLDDYYLWSFLLLLPSEQALAELMDIIDVDAIYRIRQFLKENCASQLEKKWLAFYELFYQQKDYQYTNTQAGKRRLKNTALDYLRMLKSKDYHQLAYQQFTEATNMTDQIAALSALSHVDDPLRLEALDSFYKQWEKESLVLDKWFAIQAMSERPNTIEEVKKLWQHPRFDIKNPNKIWSLIVSFCQKNPVKFHNREGTGYQFLGECVQQLDEINPIVAARIVAPLTNWHRYDEQRQMLMKKQLENIINGPSVSKNVLEIVSKSLNF